MNLQLQPQQPSMTTFSTQFLSHTLNFRNRTSRHSNPNFVTSSTPILNEGNTNDRRTRINQERFGVNETRPKLDHNYDFRDTELMESLYLLQQMVNRGYNPCVILCTKLMKCFFNSKKIEKAIQVMEILEKHGEPDVFAYNTLINGFCRADKVDAANKVLDRMIKRGLAPNVFTYTILIENLCRRGKLDLALRVMDQLLKDNCRPTVVTYTILIKATIIEAGIDEAMKLFDEMLSRGLQPDLYTYCILFGALWSSGNQIRALEMILEMLSKGIDPDKTTYNLLIRCLCKDGLVDQATELLVDMMESHKFQPTVINYNAVILGLCKAQRFIDAIEVLAAMNQRGCMPNERTYLLLIRGIGFGGWQNDAMELANSLVNMDAISEASFKSLFKRSL